MPLNNPKRRLLLLPPSWLGDVVMAQPAMRAVCLAEPWQEVLVFGRPWLADLLPYLNLPAARFAPHMPRGGDVAVVFANSFRSAWQLWRSGFAERWGFAGQWRRWLLTHAPKPRLNPACEHHRRYFLDLVEQLHLPVIDEEVKLYTSEASIHAGTAWLKERGLDADRTICVAPGAQFGGAKRYPPESYASVLAQLSAEDWHILLLGTAPERPIGERCLAAVTGKAVNAAGETRLAEALQVLAASRMLLCNDSGLMHVTAGFGKPVVAVFGATDPKRTAPSGPRAHLIYRPAACSPCLARECKVAGQPCMANVLPEEVVHACLEELACAS